MSRRILLGTTVLIVIAVVLLLWAERRARPVPEARSRTDAASGRVSSSADGTVGRAQETHARGDLTIRGRVLGRKGPVPGATIVATTSAGDDVLSERRCQCGNECGQKLLECGCGEAAGQLMELVAERRGEVQPVARATTDGDGRFLLTGLSEGTYAIWAEAPRVGAAVAQGIRAGDADVVVNLGAGIEIAGTVKREDGRAVAGAVVTGIYAKHSRFFEVATGADGAFSLGSLPEGDYTIVASAPGLLPSRERVTNESSRKLKLELAMPRSIAGTVTLEGAPAGGAAVLLHGEHRRQEIRTAPDGAFAFGALRPGRYELRAAANDRVAQEAVTIAKGDVAGITLALRAGVDIEGKVVDEAGAAVAGVRITADELAPSRRSRVAAARSGAEGRFRLGPVEPGEFELSAKLEGYVRGDAVKVVAVENATAELVIVRARPIRGRVVDAEGSPVREVWVTAVTKRVRAGSDEKASARTAADGTFTLDVPGGDYEVTAQPDGFREARIAVRAPASDVLVRLERGATIEVEVVDENGVPVADAGIAILPQSGHERTRTWTSKGRTDREGHLVVSGVGAGPVLVIAGRPGDEGEWWSGSMAHTRVDVPEAGTTTVKIRFDAALAISGSVVGPDGGGIPEAKVRAWASEERRRAKDEVTEFAERSSGAAVTDRSGRFTVRGLRAGEHALLAMKDGFDGPTDVPRAQAGASNVHITLTPTAVLRGRVVGDGGAPVLRFRVNGATRETSDGRFEFPVTSLSRFYQGSGGPLRVRFSADGYASAERSLSAERRGDVDLGDVVLSAGRTISGVVVDAATGGPIAAARVRPIFVEEAKQYLSDSSSDSRPEGLVVTGADGTFSIPHVGETALLRVVRDGYAPATAPVGRDQLSLRIALGRGGAIAIRVLAASGEPMAGVELAVMGRAEGADASSTEGMLGVYGGKTDASGRYEVSGLLAGTYFIHLNSPDRNPGLVAQPVALRDGQRVDVELQARQTGTTLQLSISGPGAKGAGELHVGLLRGVISQITGASDLVKIGVPIQPRDDGTPDAPVFELLAPGPYTALVAKLEGNGLRVFTQSFDVGTGPRQHVDVVVPAELPLITR